MDELNDLLRGMAEGMNGGRQPNYRDAADRESADDMGTAPGRDRPAPPGLPSRSQRLGRAQPVLCEMCGGAGFLIDDLPVGHPDYGRPVPCRCKLDERRSRQRNHFRDVHKLAAVARFTFETFDTSLLDLPPNKRDSLVRAYDTAHEFALKPDGWLLFTGTYGCGKTHLAAAIANHRIENDQSAVFVVVPDLLDHLRSTFDPSSEASYDDLFDEVRNTAVLILDDLGVQVASPWTQEKMFQILNDRYNRKLPTVFTTNQRLEDLDQRLRSRLQDQNLVKHFKILATDYRRAGENVGQGDLSTLRFHASQTFETFEVQRRNSSAHVNSNLRRVKEAAEAFALNGSGWLVLLGASGAGKTHLAAAISNALRVERRDDVMFVVVPDLLDYLRGAFNPQSPVPYDRRFDELKRTPMLVLDALGMESATDWAKEKLFQLLDFRYTRLLPTVIASSIPENKLDPWLRTRINDALRCQVLTIEATSYHGSADQVDAHQLKPQRKPSSGEISFWE
jgi:DNA replication protein DnaC